MCVSLGNGAPAFGEQPRYEDCGVATEEHDSPRAPGRSVSYIFASGRWCFGHSTVAPVAPHAWPSRGARSSLRRAHTIAVGLSGLARWSRINATRAAHWLDRADSTAAHWFDRCGRTRAQTTTRARRLCVETAQGATASAENFSEQLRRPAAFVERRAVRTMLHDRMHIHSPHTARCHSHARWARPCALGRAAGAPSSGSRA